MKELIIGYLICIFLFGFSIVLWQIIGLVLPGKKGLLKILREADIEESEEEKERQKFEDRLKTLGFKITRSEKELIKASRAICPNVPSDFPFYLFPILVSIQFQEIRTNVYINFRISTFVFHDIWEFKYLNALSDYILSDNFDQRKPPQVQRQSPYNTIMMIVAIITLVFSVSFHFYLWKFQRIEPDYILHSLGMSHFFISLLYTWCYMFVRKNPKGFKESVLGFYAYLISLVSLVFFVFSYFYHLKESKIYALVFYVLVGLLFGPLLKRRIS